MRVRSGMENRMSGSVRKFARNTKGAFAMQFALMAMPLCVCTGLAIDGGRAFLAHYELASALDAAALAAGSTINEDADLDAVARRFVEMNFKTQHDDPIVLELISSEDDDVLTLKGSVRINTFFMPLVGQPHVNISAESEVRRGGNNVEVALALDITQSMNATRMTGLKDAAKLLIDEVVSTTQVPYFSKVAIVPWGNTVHIGSTHVTGTALAELRGDIRNTTGISGATWRNSGTTTKTISSAGWRTNTGRTISNVTWRNGSAATISGITKTNSNSRIRVQTSAAHSLANGDTVYITGANGSYTGLNGNRYKVADRTTSSPHYFWLQNIGTTTYTTPPAGSSNATAGSSQRCFTTTCELRVSSNSHGFANGDLIYIQSVNTSGGGSSPNNSWGTTYTAGSVATDNFILTGTNGPTYANYSSNGRASECYVSDCRYRIVTSASHSFAASDPLFIWGLTESGSGTSVNTAANSSIFAEDPSGSTFFLPGDGNDYRDWTSGGSVAECANNACNVVVTSNGHGLSSGERVEIKSVTGLTGINTCTIGSSGTCSSGSRLTWQVTNQSTNTFTLIDSTPALSNMANNYGSGGTSQCLSYGCAKQWFINKSGNERVNTLSNCLTERYEFDPVTGDPIYTDTAPGTRPLGLHYPGNDSLTSCGTGNNVTPLTANKTRLNNAIDDLDVIGSTAGQMGVSWGWYMLSPNFATVWDKEVANQPLPSETPELAKVLVLMTDGEFNTAHCSGVISNSYAYSSTGSAERNNCNPSRTPFQQAEGMCTAIKAQDIVIFTVGLQLNTAEYSDDFLLACATSTSHAFLAADNDELEAAFKSIATSISKLRLSK
jgi:Flp pilus assembly protein TadG